MDRKRWIDDFTVLHGRKPTIAELQEGETKHLAPNQVAVADLAQNQALGSQPQVPGVGETSASLGGASKPFPHNQQASQPQFDQANLSGRPFLAEQPYLATKKAKTLWNTQLTALGLLSRGAILILVAFGGYVVGYLFA